MILKSELRFVFILTKIEPKFKTTKFLIRLN